MNQGDHVTTATNWARIVKHDEPEYYEKRLSTTVEGCPYEYVTVIRLTERQVRTCANPNLGQLQFIQEQEANELLWDRIFTLKRIVCSQPVHDWCLEDWINSAPFLFTDYYGNPLDEKILDDEAMQKERDTWV